MAKKTIALMNLSLDELDLLAAGCNNTMHYLTFTALPDAKGNAELEKNTIATIERARKLHKRIDRARRLLMPSSLGKAKR